ncbi:MAG: DUF6906 family protein [Filifactoraceae bacterium]
MKNGKRLTRLEKMALKKIDLDPEEWFRVKRTPYNILIVNIHTGETREVRY